MTKPPHPHPKIRSVSRLSLSSVTPSDPAAPLPVPLQQDPAPAPRTAAVQTFMGAISAGAEAPARERETIGQMTLAAVSMAMKPAPGESAAAMRFEPVGHGFVRDAEEAPEPPHAAMVPPSPEMQRQLAGAAARAAAASSSARTAAMNEAARAVASKILVSHALARGTGEVSVHLKKEVLDGSEVRVSVSGRYVDVAIYPATPEAAALAEKNISALESALAAHLHGYCTATVAIKKGKYHETD